VLLVLAVGIAVEEAPNLTLNWDFARQRPVYAAHADAITAHVAGAMLALLVGPLQFLPQLRKKRSLAVHHWLGRAYLLGVLVGSAAGFYLAWFSYGGLPAHLGFASLAGWWFVTGLVAYRRIRARALEAHRRWMVRNYAMTFTAVTLRLWLLLLLFVFDRPFDEAYVAVAWICWVWNLPVAEGLIARLPAARRPAARPAAVTPRAAVA
jgi:hypothetical protein